MNNDAIGTFSQKEYNEKYDVIMNKYKMDMRYILHTALVVSPLIILYDLWRILGNGGFSWLHISRFSPDVARMCFFPGTIFTIYAVSKIQIIKRRRNKALEELEQKKTLFVSLGRFEL